MKKFIIILLFSVPMLAQTVYKTPSGEKYHAGTCRMVKNSSEKLSISEAVDLGLDPCKICKLAAIRKITSGSKAQGEKAITTQCKGKTKKGTRCKHRTSIANVYCFQHQE